MFLKGRRIFVVEDNAGHRAIMELLFEHHGAETLFSQWGSETIKKLIDFAPVDIILLDLMLPDGITGFNIFDIIREEPDFANIPIVAVSAADPITALAEAQNRGFNGFISKPIRYNVFPKQIAQLIAGEEIWYTDSQL